MLLRPAARYITLLTLLTGLSPGAALAAEALSNTAMGDNYVADTAAPRCKPLTAAQANTAKTPCLTLNSSTSATNTDQDALARHAFAGNGPHAASGIDTVVPGARQVLQNREDVVTYSSYGGGPPGGPIPDRH